LLVLLPSVVYTEKLFSKPEFWVHTTGGNSCHREVTFLFYGSWVWWCLVLYNQAHTLLP